ncbi:HAD-IIB family hydrolase [Ramlibacter sp. AN1015]|uniref:HAD-IIB family hydrolase n=1 Tax=Ramlibacter sp. AN1015 TaxID=3133428 RepID=UPI0030BE4449
MLPLSDWPLAARRGITGVLTDIDDTLTSDGSASPEALAALAALREAGLHAIAITGRPVGWSEPFALQWPIDAIVAENGAVALVRGCDGALRKHYQQDAATRARNFARMQQVAARIVATVPGAQLARDSAGRETDIAIDHSEFTQLAPAQVREVVALMRAEGMTATVSSIHVNGWYGTHDKLAGARWILRTLLGRELDAELDHWVYVGDSTNDECMFERFTHCAGVANIRRFEAQLRHPPKYVTPSERGRGFAEVAAAVLQARATATP